MEEQMQIGGSRIIESALDDVLHSSMIPYAEHVILDRALPLSLIHI